MPKLGLWRLVVLVQVLLLVRAQDDNCLTESTTGMASGVAFTDYPTWQTYGDVTQIQFFASNATTFQGLQFKYGTADGPVRGSAAGSGTVVNLPAGYKLIGVYGTVDEYITALGFTVQLPNNKVYRFATNHGFDFSDRSFEFNAPQDARLVAIGGYTDMVDDVPRLKALTVYWSSCSAAAVKTEMKPAEALETGRTDTANTLKFSTGSLEGDAFDESSFFTANGAISKVTMYSDADTGELTGFQFQYGDVVGALHGVATDNVGSISIPTGFSIVGVFGVMKSTHIGSLGLIIQLADGELNYFATEGAFETKEAVFQYKAPAGMYLTAVGGKESTVAGAAKVSALDFQWAAVEAPVDPPSPVVVVPSPSPSPIVQGPGPSPIVKTKSSQSGIAIAPAIGGAVGGLLIVLVVVAAVVVMRRRSSNKGMNAYASAHSPAASGSVASGARGSIARRSVASSGAAAPLQQAADEPIRWNDNHLFRTQQDERATGHGAVPLAAAD